MKRKFLMKNNDNKNMNNEEKQRERFETLFRQSRQKLLYIAYRVVRDIDLANDVLQDAYVKAWKKFPEYDPEKKFTNWMQTIIRNTGIDATRGNTRQQSTVSIDKIHHYPDADRTSDFYLIDKSANLQKNYEKEELYNELYTVINNLPPDLKDVMLYFSKGFSYQEISDATKISITSVRTKIHRAKLIIRKNTKLSDLAFFS